MRPTNDPEEDNPTLRVALEVYRLQSLRNMLLVVLLIQLVLIGIGVRLLLQENDLAPIPNTSHSRNSPTNRKHGAFGTRPDEVFRAQRDEHVITSEVPPQLVSRDKAFFLWT